MPNSPSRTSPATRDAIRSWSDSLDSDADVLIYGCELASTQSGQFLLSRLADLSSADVAASDDITGHASLGGDWELEFVEGQVETGDLFSTTLQQTWLGAMPSNVAPNADAGGTYNINEGEDLTLDGSGSSDSDGTITQYLWDLNDDGTFGDVTTVNPTVFMVGPFDTLGNRRRKRWRQNLYDWVTGRRRPGSNPRYHHDSQRRRHRPHP